MDMTFKEAVTLCEDINRRLGWSAEIEAGGEGEDAYLTVSARFEVGGLIYNAEIEHPGQWHAHLNRITAWIEGKH